MFEPDNTYLEGAAVLVLLLFFGLLFVQSVLAQRSIAKAGRQASESLVDPILKQKQKEGADVRSNRSAAQTMAAKPSKKRTRRPAETAPLCAG